MLYYAFKEASGSLTGVSSEQITAEFGNMLGNPGVMIVWMMIAILLSFGVCALGLEKGIEKITKVMMSCLIVLIVCLRYIRLFYQAHLRVLSFILFLILILLRQEV